MELINLDAATIPLSGKHLIEASAGTGKTYNITRIYLRLLLERELTVEQILLMTFTKDATQELRGRIDSFLRDALDNWEPLCQADDYFKQIDARVSAQKRIFMLKRALLFLDEASIFTIHGFCQRALTQHAFSSGLSFNANMSTDSRLIALEACQDWYRHLAKQADGVDSAFYLVTTFWSDPDKFMASFSKAITHESEITVTDPAKVLRHIISLARQALSSIESNEEYLNQTLITHKKIEETQTRKVEFALLKARCESIAKCSLEEPDETSFRESVDKGLSKYLFSASRHPKVAKAKIKEALAPCVQLEKALSDFAKNYSRAKAYMIVKTGIYQIRKQVSDKKKLLDILDFDDLINTLATCVNSGNNKNQTTLAKALVKQYPVALVDEFQDTDPKQFAILKGIYYQDIEQSQAFETNLIDNKLKKETVNNRVKDSVSNESLTTALYLIGDPKQAIYGFRGGDVFAYLSARSGCDYHWLMDTNWRSSPSIINAYNHLFFGSAIEKGECPDIGPYHDNAEDRGCGQNNESLHGSLIDDKVFGYQIPYQMVNAGKETSNLNICSQLAKDNENKSLHFIHFEPTEHTTAQSQRPLMAQWCAKEISLLLGNKSNGQRDSDESSTIHQDVACVSPKDIAILVRDGGEGSAIKKALLEANIASVFLSDKANLFESEQAKQIALLLKGIITPEDERSFLGAITCGLLGFDLHNLYELQQDEIAYQTLHFAFIDYREHWYNKGFISMSIAMLHRHFKLPSLNKDRVLTNILHLFELLQLANQRFLHPQELLYWFEKQCEPIQNGAEVEAELRLENDGDLVRIITQHGSKGLEYPIVFIPFATRQRNPLKVGNRDVSYIEYHNDNNVLVLSLDGDEKAKKCMANEAYAESIRLLYVAITRAERKCYIFTTPFKAFELSPLGQALKWKKDDSIADSIRRLIAQAPNDISFDTVNLEQLEGCFVNAVSSPSSQIAKEKPKGNSYQASRFYAHIERDWWLSSFTALSKRLRHDGKSSPNRDSDLTEIQADSSSFDRQRENESLLRFNMLKGARTGNFLHSLLEHTNFTQDDWASQLVSKTPTLSELAADHSLEDLVNWLNEIIHCPLTANTDHLAFSLKQIPNNKMLKEVEFYFPMENASSERLTELLSEHRRDYYHKRLNAKVSCVKESELDNNSMTLQANRVSLPSYASLKGMMHGFIDLVFEHEGKYFLCDYKSSHLGDNLDDYSQASLHENIERNHYDLQYLIYSVALHRYLKASLEDYDPKTHFGGSYYLYLRGMKASDMKQDNEFQSGVYFRQIELSTLEKFDALFSGKFPHSASNLDDKLSTQELM